MGVSLLTQRRDMSTNEAYRQALKVVGSFVPEEEVTDAHFVTIGE